MNRIEHRIFLLLSSVRVKSFVNTTGCLFVWQENENRIFCLFLIGWSVSIGAADVELRPFKFCAKKWSARGSTKYILLFFYDIPISLIHVDGTENLRVILDLKIFSLVQNSNVNFSAYCFCSQKINKKSENIFVIKSEFFPCSRFFELRIIFFQIILDFQTRIFWFRGAPVVWYEPTEGFYGGLFFICPLFDTVFAKDPEDSTFLCFKTRHGRSPWFHVVLHR